MFTGIVEEIGVVKNVKRGAKSMTFTISGSVVLDNMKIGDSVAVNGVCLTVTGCSNYRSSVVGSGFSTVNGASGGTFVVDVVQETLDRSSIRKFVVGTRVNLERAMPVNGRFGGHIVQGHIDGTGTITKVQRNGDSVLYSIRAADSVIKYIVEKGSITVDGISLTVSKVERDSFGISIIPHTMISTVLAERKTGDTVNLETDVIGKYVERLLGKNQ